jgi:hypothetical protein
MKKILGTLVLVLCLCGIRLDAQESVSGGWSPLETKQEVSRSVPVAITANGPSSVKFVPSVVNKKEFKMKTADKSSLPFPTFIPEKIVYPRKAIRRGWEGQTVVAVEVLSDGSVGRTIALLRVLSKLGNSHRSLNVICLFRNTWISR